LIAIAQERLVDKVDTVRCGCQIQSKAPATQANSQRPPEYGERATQAPENKIDMIKGLAELIYEGRV
jgi:hypothetical protein